MKGSISLDDVRPFTSPTGSVSWLVICGECKGRSMAYDAGNRHQVDFHRPWIIDGSQAKAQATLKRHNALHHGENMN